MVIEPEAARVGFTLQLVQMGFEIGDALFGIELHGDGQIGAHFGLHPPPGARGQAQIARTIVRP